MADINTTEARNETGTLDILHGCDEIARFLFNKDDTQHQRKVYRLHALDKRPRFPTFKMGGVLCARRAAIQKYIEDQENK
ncbi:DNA-binding protein [Bradyrhizobium elkanii]|uniref:Uncharacterized protein n=1 Tax=Bradyrhizobium elkanii TaxID=29448 RepID=A0A8I1YDH1_BRAEL|nr:DNA-binding protein [Bradyrhizobium elkanii]MBP1297402.1 hypothetical protein [Bradyrhizobium elkanii]